MNANTTRLSTMRLYGGSIAIVSGLYSGYLATTGMQMTTGAWGMLALGVIVLVHGIVLLTPAAGRLGEASGPLMIAYSVLMLLNQAWIASDDWMGAGGTGMNGGMTGGSMGTGMGTDAGMVAIALLMLASGIIMTIRREMLAT